MAVGARIHRRDAAGTTTGHAADARVLLTGWFTFLHGEATAGDLLAAETIGNWLSMAGIDYDTARSPVLGGPCLDDVDPREYTHLAFACGPATGWQIEQLLDRFSHCTAVAVGVGVFAETPPGFDILLDRDGLLAGRPDLALAAEIRPLPPRVAVVRAHEQNEYPDGRYGQVHRVIDEVLGGMDVAVIEHDTRVDPRNLVGRRAVDVEAVFAGVDAVITTRMHGLVLALRRGVPAVAIDPVPGGAKISQQATELGWPAVQTVDELTAAELAAQVGWSLTADAARTAHERAVRGRRALETVRGEFLDALRHGRAPIEQP